MDSATGAGPTRLENPSNFFTPSFRQQSVLQLMSANPIHPQMHELVDAAAQGLGLATVRVVASAPDDLEQAFQKLTHEKCDAIG